MLGNRVVVHWLRRHSKRPAVAMHVWALLLTKPFSGILRGEIAKELGIAAGDVSSIMTELEHIKVISRYRDGRLVRYVVNPSLFVTTPSEEEEEDPRQISFFEILEDEGARLSLMPREIDPGVPWTPAGSTTTGLSLKRLTIRSLGI